MKSNRVTPVLVEELEENEVFVFGSNKAGRHGKGAAKFACDRFGAEYGQPEGLQGNSYAIPTKDFNVQYGLPIDEIKMYVDLFLELAKHRPDLYFYVTEIGCGYAGFKPEHIAPLFEEAKDIDNISLPEIFWNIINS